VKYKIFAKNCNKQNNQQQHTATFKKMDFMAYHSMKFALVFNKKNAVGLKSVKKCN